MIKLRFSIRTLLVLMTLFAIWCGYHLNWIRQRRAVVKSPRVSVSASHDSFHRPRAPGLLWMFGELGYQTIGIQGEGSLAEAERLHLLFPEGNIVWSVGSQSHILP